MLLLLVFLFVSFLFLLNFLSKYSSNIPGPPAFPILGNYLNFPPNFYEYAYDLSKKFGPICRLRFGSSGVIILNRFDLIRDALAKSSFSSRPDWISMRLQSEFDASFAFRVSGPHWRFLRKHAVKAMAILKNSASESIQIRCERAVERLINNLQNKEDESIQILNPSVALFRCVCTIMGETCFGRQFDPDDPELWRILNSAQDTSRLTKIGSVSDCFPWAKICFRSLIDDMRKAGEVFRDYVVDRLERSYKSGDTEENKIHDLTDALRQLSENGENHLTEHQRQLIRYSAIDLFGAGLFTTLTNLEWALLVLSIHKNVVQKMRQEINSVCTNEKFVTLNMRPHLLYVEATVLELLRFNTVLPFGVPHCTTEPIQLANYTIPANTPILTNIWAVHHDPDTFTEPFKFHPDRFLIKLENGTVELDTGLVSKVIPFSTGIRRCPGENLARQNLFLIIANIVKRLDFRLITEYDDLNRCECNFSRKPLPYELHFRAQSFS